MKVSVIISTFNRLPSLRAALASYRYQTYDEFEIVVVNGPSTDGTSEYLEEMQGIIKIANCPEANISMSRNIGICQSAGDILAFIDDDAIPDQYWLTTIVEKFRTGEVTALGGFVLDDTGMNFQSKFLLGDRFGGHSNFVGDVDPSPSFSFPFTRHFPSPMGCNVAIAKRELVEVGGFDEQYDYFLDESDVIVRLIDSGYRVEISPTMVVHHKFATSALRRGKWPLDWYKIVKNKAYFSIANGLPSTILEADDNLKSFLKNIEDQSCKLHLDGALSQNEKRKCIASSKEGALQGKIDAQTRLRAQIHASDYFVNKTDFRKYPKMLRPSSPMVVCLLTPGYPPTATDGIPRYTKTLAEGLAGLGVIVHVINLGDHSEGVTFQEGIWIHNIRPKNSLGTTSYPGLPDSIQRAIEAYRAEVVRISERIHPVNVVQGPIWDLTTLAFISDPRFVTITFMCTTFAIKRLSETSWYMNNKAMIDQIIKMEKRIIIESEFLNYDSTALMKLSAELYGVETDASRQSVIYLGTSAPAGKAVNAKDDSSIRILFVGRLEERKGIDVLLAAIPTLAEMFPETIFEIVGNKEIKGVDGRSYEEIFLEQNKNAKWLDRVHFVGYVNDEQLDEYYQKSQIFVVPSRYESFGQILIEAMARSKAIVATSVGGIVEVIGSPPAGVLVQAGDVEGLLVELKKLIADGNLRIRLGELARQRYEAHFSATTMCKNTMNYFKYAIDQHESTGQNKSVAMKKQEGAECTT